MKSIFFDVINLLRNWRKITVSGFSSSKLLILLIIFVTISSENLVSSGIVFLGFFLTALWIDGTLSPTFGQ